jgi:hypothetical protein
VVSEGLLVTRSESPKVREAASMEWALSLGSPASFSLLRYFFSLQTVH